MLYTAGAPGGPASARKPPGTLSKRGPPGGAVAVGPKLKAAEWQGMQTKGPQPKVGKGGKPARALKGSKLRNGPPPAGGGPRGSGGSSKGKGSTPSARGSKRTAVAEKKRKALAAAAAVVRVLVWEWNLACPCNKLILLIPTGIPGVIRCAQVGQVGQVSSLIRCARVGQVGQVSSGVRGWGLGSRCCWALAPRPCAALCLVHEAACEAGA